jgi:acrylyl-CoA reductase (NADPH)
MVESSTHPDWKPGDRVVLNGWGVGETHLGGYAEKARVKGDWLVPAPAGMTGREAMAIGTAGYTAMLAVMALERHGITPERGPVLVTGAAGGVGRFAVQLAHRGGAHVTGVVRNAERGAGLRELGADELISELEPEGEPFDLLLESVGGASLAAALTRVAPQGTVVAFGASSPEPTTFDVSGFYRRGGPRLYGMSVFDELARGRSGVRDLELLLAELAAGRLDPQIDLTLDWREADAALAALMDRRVAGKAVLTVG